MEQKPDRKYLKLKVENNRTYEVDDFNLAEFIAAVEKRKPEGLEGGANNKSDVEPVDAKLYPVPDNSRFLESVVQNLKRFKPAMDAEKKNASCSNKTKRAKFAHQEVLAVYFTMQNPYRGILIYHGMGSGKTCSSVAMAENLAGNQKPIWVLTPKALEANYRAEMVKCSKIYQQSQHWVARKEGWIVLKGRPPNFDELGPQEQQEVSAHMKTLMDREKAYRFVSYSGMSCQNIRAQFTAENNPFDNSIVVIDEVHVLVELIAKNLADNSSPFPLLYEWLLDAEGCRVIALSGTPRAHKLTDLGVLYNLVYGYMKVWTVHTPKLIEDPKMKRFIHQQRSEGKKLEVTRTPYGFEANYDQASGALLDLHKVDDTWDEHKFRTELSKFGVVGDRVDKHKLLPDKDVFVDEEVFQRRIQGLTSYFPDLGNLMPKLHPRRIHEVALSELQAKETKVHLLHFPKDLPRIVQRPLDACQTSSAEDPKYIEDIRKTIVALKEKGVFKDGLDVYGPKIKEVVKQALAGPARQLVYTAELENAFFLAEALVEKGYAQLVLTPPNPPEQMGWAVIPAKDPAKTFVLYTGSPAELEVLVEAFNKGGARLFLASAAAVEGISLGDVADVHLVEPSVDPTKLMQVVGRARRMCKNTDVEGVTPHVYLAGKHEKTVYEDAAKHQEEIDRWLELVKETAVDCALHRSKCYSATKTGGETKAKRKRIKMDVNGEARHFYVDATHGERQPMYKAAEGAEKYGFVSFGPPHVFFNESKEKVPPTQLML